MKDYDITWGILPDKILEYNETVFLRVTYCIYKSMLIAQ